MTTGLIRSVSVQNSGDSIDKDSIPNTVSIDRENNPPTITKQLQRGTTSIQPEPDPTVESTSGVARDNDTKKTNMSLKDSSEILPKGTLYGMWYVGTAMDRKAIQYRRNTKYHSIYRPSLETLQ